MHYLTKRFEASRIDSENKLLRDKIMFAQPTIKVDLKPIYITAAKSSGLASTILEKKKNTLKKTKS